MPATPKMGKHTKKMERSHDNFQPQLSPTSFSSPAQTKKSSGIRIVGSRIYDSVNGKSCHQCRQKTRDFVASCKNLKKDKSCPNYYCHKCLLNRYGEKAEEMELLENWKCPKCRNICNCSLCRKKIGCIPTGILVHTAKATGFSSVSEMLQVIDPGNSCKNVKDIVCNPKQPVTPRKESLVSPRKRGKENSFDGKEDLDEHPQNLILNPDVTKPKKIKREKLKEHDGNIDNIASLKKSSSRRPCSSKKASNNEVKSDNKDDDILQNRPDETKPKKMKRKKLKEHQGNNYDDASLKECSARRPCISKEVSSNEVKTDKKDGDIPQEKPDETKPKKIKREKLKEHDGNNHDGASLKKSSSRRPYISKEASKNEVKADQKADDMLQGKSYGESVSQKDSLDSTALGQKGEEGDCTTCQNVGMIDNAGASPNIVIRSHKVVEHAMKFHAKEIDVDAPLPQGISLTNVAGIDVAPQDVGHTLQFLEFCAAFGKVFDLGKGHPESVLRELIRGCSGHRGQHSLSIRFHIKLLSLILKDLDQDSPPLTSAKGNNSWLKALGKFISESPFALKDIPSDCFDRGSDGYDELDFSKKLRLLNFLCDESLCTEKLRSWIDNQNSKFFEREKEAKEKVIAAKEKKKQKKRKLKDERVKAILAQDSAPLSIKKHEAVVSQIKTEVSQAHAEMLEAINMLPKKMKQRSDAVRTEPILVDVNGLSFWRLKVYAGEPDILLQDMRTCDADLPDEKWFSYDLGLKKSIEEYISLREKKLKSCRGSRKLPIESTEAISSHDSMVDLECPTSKIETGRL